MEPSQTLLKASDNHDILNHVHTADHAKHTSDKFLAFNSKH